MPFYVPEDTHKRIAAQQAQREANRSLALERGLPLHDGTSAATSRNPAFSLTDTIFNAFRSPTRAVSGAVSAVSSAAQSVGDAVDGVDDLVRGVTRYFGNHDPLARMRTASPEPSTPSTSEPFTVGSSLRRAATSALGPVGVVGDALFSDQARRNRADALARVESNPAYARVLGDMRTRPENFTFGPSGAIGALDDVGNVAKGIASGGDDLLKSARRMIRSVPDATSVELTTAERAFDRAMETGLGAITPRTRQILEKALGGDFVDRLQPVARAVPGEPLEDVASRVAQVMAERDETIRSGDVTGALRLVNNIFRGVQAGGELSYLTIQGSIGLTTDPKSYGHALRLSMKALRDPDVESRFLESFSETAKAKGALDAVEWAKRGLRLAGTGAGNEFAITGRLGRVPLIKQSNQGFGTFGDVLRLDIADTLLEEAKLAGRTIDDRTLEGIVKTANRITGTSNTRAFSSWGEVLTFAPRYFASKLENIAQLASTNQYERQLARRTFGRWLGVMTAATVGINEAFGNETDFNPVHQLADGRYVKNPNFMRIRALDRDWSLFGAYDSLLGLAIAAGTGNLQDAARSTLTSPVISKAWDLLSGQTITGDATRDTTEGAPLGGLASLDTAEYALKSVLPFAVPTFYEAAQSAAQGKTGAAVGAAAQGAIGLRGSPLSPTDRLDQVSPGGDFNKLDRQGKQQVLTAHPDLAELRREGRLGSQGITASIEKIEVDREEQLQVLADSTLDGRAFRERYDEIQRDAAARKAQARIEHGAKDLKPRNDNERALDRWYSVAVYGEGGVYDPDATEDARAAVLRGLTPSQRAYVEKETSTIDASAPPKVRALLETRKALTASGYWNMRDDAWEAITSDPGFPAEARQFRSYEDWSKAVIETVSGQLAAQYGVSPSDPERMALVRDRAATVLARQSIEKAYRRVLSKSRENWIAQHPDLATKAVRFGYLNPSSEVGDYLLRTR